MKMKPISVPQSAPEAAPVVVRLISWLSLICAELDQILALHRQDLLADLLGLLLGREGDEDQIAHGRCPSMC